VFVQGAAAAAVTVAAVVAIAATAAVAGRLASDGNSINHVFIGYEIKENYQNTYRLLLSIDW